MHVKEGEYGYGFEGELSDNMEIKDGLVFRWCHSREYRCGHYISTRYETLPAEQCDRNNYWNHDITQDDVANSLVHKPNCKRCLSDTNSYIFHAFYDVSKPQIEELLRQYRLYYPADAKQPLFFVSGSNELLMRLPKTHSLDGDADGELNLDTLVVDFWVDTLDVDPYDFESYIFNLSEDYEGAGWNALLRVFPQDKRVDTQTEM